MDENFQTYLNRVARLTLPDTHESQLQNIQESPKFQAQATGERKPVPFPGYSIITPPWAETTTNNDFYKFLHQAQTQLLEELPEDFVIPVIPDSFHLTLADLIWDGAYRNKSQNPEFEEQLRSNIGKSLAEYGEANPSTQHNRWLLLGFIVRPRAIAVCLVPKDEASYNQILHLRRLIYQNPSIIGLGIEQQYHFTAHITLGYFGDVSEATLSYRQRLYASLNRISNQWLELDQPELLIDRGEVRKFDDMTNYYRQPSWASVEF